MHHTYYHYDAHNNLISTGSCDNYDEIAHTTPPNSHRTRYKRNEDCDYAKIQHRYNFLKHDFVRWYKNCPMENYIGIITEVIDDNTFILTNKYKVTKNDILMSAPHLGTRYNTWDNRSYDLSDYDFEFNLTIKDNIANIGNARVRSPASKTAISMLRNINNIEELCDKLTEIKYKAHLAFEIHYNNEFYGF
jgi:hypothetical protein